MQHPIYRRLSIIFRCAKYGTMLETYLACYEKNVLAFISPPVLRANSRMTVERNRMSREERGLSEIYSPSYTGASQARSRSRRCKTRSSSLASLRVVKRCREFSEFHPSANSLGTGGETKDERTRRGAEGGKSDVTRGRILCARICRVSTSK